MYLTARQIEQIVRETGSLVLPWGARLTPAAQDLVRARKMELRFDVAAPATKAALAAASTSVVKVTPARSFLWWSGIAAGPCKAALAMASRDEAIAELVILEDASKVDAAARALSAAIAERRAAGGILIVEHSGLAGLLCNRDANLRAVVGTSLASIDAAIQAFAANVLILEPASFPVMSLKNMILRFARPVRPADSAARFASQAKGGCACESAK